MLSNTNMQTRTGESEINRIRNISMMFILGHPRSGTSLLQNMLNAHPEIIGGPESKFMVLLYPRFGHRKNWKKEDIIEFVEMLYTEPLFKKLWYLDKKQLTETLLSIGEITDYALLCKIVYYQLRRGKENVRYICDKNPEYILFINTLLKIYPDAKFIHIVREPRDTIYSHIISFNVKNITFKAYQWVAYNSIVEKKKRNNPERYITVLYETLVNDAEATMKKIADFIGVPFSDWMTENQSPVWLSAHLERTGVTNKEKLVHRNLLKPIDASNIGKWKNNLSPYEQTLTEVITGDYAKKTYAYDIDGNKTKKEIKISTFKLLKIKCLYYSWQAFAKLKFKSLWFNLLYSRLKRKLNPNLPPWEYF